MKSHQHTASQPSSKSGLILLRKGLYYNSKKDSYVIEIDDKESLGVISVGLQLTKRCDAGCIHCAASQTSAELSTNSMIKLIQKLHDEGCVRVSFTGGEPLLRSDLPEILKASKEVGMVNTLSTNGLKLNRELIQKIKPYINNIRFSLHGLELTNDYIFQKKGAYRTIIEKIKLAQSEGLSVGVVFSSMRSNQTELIELAKELGKLGVEKLIIFTLMSAGRAQDLFAEEFVHVSELNEQIEKINKLVKKMNWNLEVTLVDWRLEGQCLLIDPMGTLYAYDLSQDDHYLRLGNALEEDVRDLWHKFPHKENYFKYYQHH